MRILLLFLLASAAFAETPNIVVLLADDLGYGDLHVYNAASKIKTPNLDRLAGEGTRFTNAHTPASVCTPTRYGLLTGRYPWRSRLKSGVLRDSDPPLIEAGRLTLPEMLKRKGYETAAIGKWHLGKSFVLLDKSKPVSAENIDWSKPEVDGPLDHGFTYYFGLAKPGWAFLEGRRPLARPSLAFDVTNLPAFLMGPNNQKGWKSPGFEFDRMLPRFTEEAVGFIDRSAAAGKPFFLYWTPITPHRPVTPSEDFIGKSAAGVYGDFVVQLDWAVGEILAAIERNGATKDTLVILSSDNGPEIDAYRRVLEYEHYSMGDWRGVKRDNWEGGHRVAFLARWPGRYPSDRTNDETVCQTDLFATTASIVGYDLPNAAAEDSYDILPALEGKRLSKPIREATVHQAMDGHLAIRQGDWVLIDWKTGDSNRGGNGEPEWFKRERGVVAEPGDVVLYNLRDDPQETRNRVAEEPQTVGRLKALLDQYRAEGRSVARR
ncbi:MAG: arylsulfatase [Bryobacterales bacterium]